MRAWLFPAVLLFTGATAGPALAQADYEIKLFRPNKAGERYRLEASGQQTREAILRAEGQELRRTRDGFTVDLSAEVELLEVDAKGNVLRAKLTIEKAEVAVGERRRALLAPGTQVLEQRGGSRQVFQIDGRDVSAELKDALGLVLQETNDPGIPNDDELMGTRERQRVGARWQVSREAFARLFSEDPQVGLGVKPADVEGSGELRGLERIRGVDTMRVAIAVTIAATPREQKQLGPKPVKVKIDVRYSALLPVDTRLDALEETANLKMSLAMQEPPREGRPPGTIETVWEQNATRRFAPLRR